PAPTRDRLALAGRAVGAALLRAPAAPAARGRCRPPPAASAHAPGIGTERRQEFLDASESAPGITDALAGRQPARVLRTPSEVRGNRWLGCRFPCPRQLTGRMAASPADCPRFPALPAPAGRRRTLLPRSA